MKALKHINTIAIIIPFILLLIASIEEIFIYIAAYSTMLTGLIQVLLGLFLLYKNPKNRYLRTYIITVILFFLLWFINAQVNYINIITFILFSIPLILAIYFSLIIYKKLYL